MVDKAPILKFSGLAIGIIDNLPVLNSWASHNAWNTDNAVEMFGELQLKCERMSRPGMISHVLIS